METNELMHGNRTDWEEYARCYDVLSQLSPYQSMMDEVARRIDVQPGQRVLDAACGTGNLMVKLLTAIDPDARIIGCDSSMTMIERAKEKLAGNGVTTIMFTDLNARLPFPDSTFDRIASVNTLYALADPLGALREFSRVLKVGGKLVMVTPRQGYENGLILKAHCGSMKPDEYWRNAHSSPERERLLIHEATNDPELIRSLVRVAMFNRIIYSEQTFHFFTADGLRDMLQEAGFMITHLGNTYADQNHCITAVNTSTQR
jgi:ubiquinone/menaquinone biosynthesis C-methylase UbiE